MKKLKKILAVIVLLIGFLSCTKDNEEPKIVPVTVQKEYPTFVLERWDGSVTDTDFINGNEEMIGWNVKANGVLEVYRDEGVSQTTAIKGEWYMQGDIFYCTYLSKNGKNYTYKLIKNKALVMLGFRGINGETSGSGRVYIYVI